jgi:very-short-patch-repair endonuclease
MRMALPLDRQCQLLGLPVPVGEYRFHPVRKWRFDYAWPTQKVALEIQGGVFAKGRHVQGAGLRKEYEKLNAAAADGWRVLFILPEQVSNGTAMQIIETTLRSEL